MNYLYLIPFHSLFFYKVIKKNYSWVFGILLNKNFKTKIMNIKRTFGGLLTALGIGGLIYAAVLFVNTSGSTRDIKALVIYSILGLLFFFAGISLVRTTKDES